MVHSGRQDAPSPSAYRVARHPQIMPRDQLTLNAQRPRGMQGKIAV